MKSRGLLTACLLLLALSAAVWWSNKKAATAEKSTVESTTTKLVNIPEDQFREIEIKHRTGETVRLQRNDSKWQITSPKPLPADPDAVSSMVSALSSLSSDRTVDEKATGLDQYGLTQPAIELDITDKNKKTARLMIGDDTPAGTAVYASIAGDPRVFALSSYKKNNFNKSPNELRDKRLLTFDSDKVTSIVLTARKQTMEFARSKEDWQIVKPGPFRADRSEVEELLRTLRDTKMDLGGSEDDKKLSAAFDSGKPFASARVTDLSGPEELQVQKNKGDYYAKSSALSGVYKISSGTGTGLDKGIDDFKNKKLFDFGFADPEKIELHDGSRSYFLTRGGTDWWSNGTRMDAGTVSALVDKIRDLSATKFLETGSAVPVLSLTVISDNGKRVEKVIFSKNGDDYVAKRENEPAFYELNTATVTELQKSAANLKPVAAPAPPPAKK
jgi:hypothetical protein